MKIIPVAEARAKLSEYIDLSEKEAVIITKNGRPCALIVPIDQEQDDLEHMVLSYNKRLREILATSIKSVEEGRTLTKDEFLAAVEKKMAKKKIEGVEVSNK